MSWIDHGVLILFEAVDFDQVVELPVGFDHFGEAG